MVQKMKLGFSVNLENYPELTNDLLEELRRWGHQHGVREIPLEQLVLFAHSCFYDAEAAKRCMHTYYRMRTTVPEFFAKRNPRSDELQFSLKALRFAMLPVPDPQGNRIIFHRLGDTRPHQYMFDDGIKLLNMTADASLYKHGVSPGYIFLFDMQGVRLGHLMRLSISSIRRFFEYLQDGMPVRLKGIHVLNTVWFMDKVLALIRPFMKRELFETLHLYRDDVTEIYKHIPEDCLPSDFGGKLDSIDQLHEAHCRVLDELRDYFEEEEKLFRSWHPRCSNDSKQKEESANAKDDE